MLNNHLARDTVDETLRGAMRMGRPLARLTLTTDERDMLHVSAGTARSNFVASSTTSTRIRQWAWISI
jgi:hypothetical protein